MDSKTITMEINELVKNKDKIMFRGAILSASCFLMPNIYIKSFLFSMLVLVLLSYYNNSKKITIKTREKIEQQDVEIIEKLRKECFADIERLKNIFIVEGYNVKKGQNDILDELEEMAFYFCTTENDYIILQQRIMTQTYFVFKNYVFNKHKENRSSNPIFNSSDNSKTSKYLGVLGLTMDVTDFSLVKNAYRNLIKKHHPDVNKSKDALDISSQLNEAYDYLENHLATG